jgi:hypothetical protein
MELFTSHFKFFVELLVLGLKCKLIKIFLSTIPVIVHTSRIFLSETDYFAF